MTEPTIADIDRCIETIERSNKKWSGNADYRRLLETELFCLREVRARLGVAQRTRDQIYEVVLRELETKHPIPTTVLLATRIANALSDTSTERS